MLRVEGKDWKLILEKKKNKRQKIHTHTHKQDKSKQKEEEKCCSGGAEDKKMGSARKVGATSRKH